MSFTLRWVNVDELDRVAETRARCYAHAARDAERFKEVIRADPRGRGGDFLLAERDGAAVGTSTGLPMTMWLRGAAVPCQGVAYVGTIKTHRRVRVDGAGVATQLMNETLRRARERGQVVSALMPFRASFYEHFGYGLVDHRHDWTVPLSILPTGSFDGMRFYEPGDLPELARCHQRTTERGQADIKATSEFRPRDCHGRLGRKRVENELIAFPFSPRCPVFFPQQFDESKCFPAAEFVR